MHKLHGMSIDKSTVWGETPLQTLIINSSVVSVMAHHATSGRYYEDSSIFETSQPFAQPDASLVPSPETDLGILAAKFAAPTGPGLSPDLAIDLALQMVLHEVVEQACVSTDASGAAIALYHDGELVCRASHGETAPQLGSRLDLGVGISGECLRTGQIQLCNDVRSDLRVDLEACFQLGVHSVVVLPLSRAEKMMGIFEVFSPRPSAFGEREITLLQAFAQRILNNLDRAIELSAPAMIESTPSSKLTEDLPSDANETRDSQLVPSDQLDTARPWTEILTWALGIVVLACATWLGFRVVQRFNREQVVQRPASRINSPSAASHTPPMAGGSSNRALAESQTVSSSSVPSSTPARDPTLTSRPTHAKTRTPEGSLLVYENGKEVFRLPASTPEADAPGTSVEKAASLQPNNIVELPASAAEANLIHRVEPEYPEDARLGGIQGPVVLEVRIRPDGSVAQCNLVSGEPVLANAAITAVKQWRFKSHRVKGQPAEMQTTITLNFRLPS